jgi:hypothetical protein
LTLTFERNAALVVRGTLALHGPAQGDIRLLPAEDHWGGVYVLGADRETPSVLENVEIRGVRGIRRDGWETHGGVTFARAPVRFDRCRVLDADAPTAVHVVGAPFEWIDSEFGISSGDLALLEQVQGSVERCAFHDTLGAALRVRDSEVGVQSVSLLRAWEAGLSAEAGSVVQGQGIRAADVGVALSGVDGSTVRVHDARVGQAHVAALVAYRESAAQAPATIEVNELLLEDSSRPALAQEGSRVTIDGLSVEAQALDPAGVQRPRVDTPPMRPLHVRFGPAIWLVGYDLTTPERAPGETVEVILYWRTFASLDRQYTIFVHLLDAAGQWVTGWDMMPRYNTYPTTDWPVAELIDDAHIVPLAADIPPGEYTLALGMYYWGTGERMPAYTRQGETIPGAAVVLQDKVRVK